MRRLTIVARWASMLVALASFGALGETPGHAEGTANVAGLVILDEDGDLGFALVTFEESEISGMELLRRSGADPVTITFGGLGEGVCGIGETGCAVDVCRQRMCQSGSAESPFWQSFAAGADARWKPLQLGASADRVKDGDVRLWAWTGTGPELGSVTIRDISQKTKNVHDRVIWASGSNGGDAPGASPLWLGLGLVGVAGIVASVVTLRSRPRSG